MRSWKPAKPPFRLYEKKVFARYASVCDMVYQIGESAALRKPCKKIRVKDINTAVFKDKVEYVNKCLFEYRKRTGMGRGTSAVQVGISECFSVIYTGQTITRKGLYSGN